jgi:tRNA U34 2-thiouridine synthase MnmA/TrmU
MFSGGLDSTLAAKILEEQGIEVVCVNFKSYFFDEKLASQMAKKYKLNLRVIDFSEEHLEVVKHPKYGYGRQ